MSNAIIEPAPLKSKSKSGKINKNLKKKIWLILGIALLCMAVSFISVWAVIRLGIVKIDAETINDNSQTIVMQQSEVISEVFNRVSPSAVAITTEIVSTSTNGYTSSNGYTSEGSGSGIIISEDGYILTNKHVVPEGTQSINVVTSDGQEYTDVEVVGRDPSNDIAFIKINDVSGLTAAQIGDSNDVAAGQQVIAIGNALGIFRNSVTSGIISGVGRPLTASDETGTTTEQLEDMFQTDAAINLGNSGGPLVNLKGEVIGINTAVSSDGESIGFAIPINAAKTEIASVISTGKLSKAYVGVRYVTITPENAEELGVSVTKGALVAASNGQSAVVSNSPAEKASLQAGDIITKVDGTEIEPGKGFATLIAQYSPGDKVELTLIRGGKEQTVSVTLAEYPQ